MAQGRGSPAAKPEGRKGGDRSEARRGPRVLRVVVADDNRLIISGIRRALEGDDEIEIVGEAYTGTTFSRSSTGRFRTSCCSTSGSRASTGFTVSSRSGSVIPT